MTGRCAQCHRFTATREDRGKAGALAAYRVGFIKEATDGQPLREPELICLPCIRAMQPTSTA